MAPDREYYAVRASCAMFDVSALAKYSIKGEQARDFLQKLITRNIANLKVGEVLYSPWCDSRGKVIDDGTFACLAENHFQMTAAEQGESWVRKAARGFEVEITNISDDYGVLALQGPTSLSVLRELVGDGVASPGKDGQTLIVRQLLDPERSKEFAATMAKLAEGGAQR